MATVERTAAEKAQEQKENDIKRKDFNMKQWCAYFGYDLPGEEVD